MPYRSNELTDGIYRLKIAVRGEAGTHHGRGITIQFAQANGGKGFGWNWLVIDGIRVKDNSPFMYSIMNRSEKRDENIVYPWMSVCDCIVERTGDLPE